MLLSLVDRHTLVPQEVLGLFKIDASLEDQALKIYRYMRERQFMDEIDFSDFEKIEIRIGTIISSEVFKEARKPAYKIEIDLGPLGIKKSSAQITKHYEAKQLIGKQVICVCNLGKKQIGPFVSEVLITGFADENGDVVLASADQKVANGQKLF